MARLERGHSIFGRVADRALLEIAGELAKVVPSTGSGPTLQAHFRLGPYQARAERGKRSGIFTEYE